MNDRPENITVKLNASNVTRLDDDSYEIKLSTYTLSRAMDSDQLAALLENKLNCFSDDTIGKAVGAWVARWHRSLQSNFMRFATCAISKYHEVYMDAWKGMTDPRNEHAVSLAGDIASMMKDRGLPYI